MKKENLKVVVYLIFAVVVTIAAVSPFNKKNATKLVAKTVKEASTEETAETNPVIEESAPATTTVCEEDVALVEEKSLDTENTTLKEDTSLNEVVDESPVSEDNTSETDSDNSYQSNIKRDSSGKLKMVSEDPPHKYTCN